MTPADSVEPRDLFAAAALAAVIQRLDFPPGGPADARAAADCALMYADALMAARSRARPPGPGWGAAGHADPRGPGGD